VAFCGDRRSVRFLLKRLCMTSTTNDRISRPRRILVGVDFTEISDNALRAAFALASAAGDTQVHVAWVRPGLSDGPVSMRKLEKIGDEIDRLRTHVEGVFVEWRERHPGNNVAELSVHEIQGKPAAALVNLAAALEVGLVVVGTHGRKGLARMVLGSVAADVLAEAACPVLVVRPIEHSRERALEGVADVEPLCQDCITARADSGGERVWCDRHAERHPRAHVYGYSAPSSAAARPWGF
jgi:nucleotide-binding universal stress UspA family protein